MRWHTLALQVVATTLDSSMEFAAALNTEVSVVVPPVSSGGVTSHLHLGSASLLSLPLDREFQSPSCERYGR